MLNGTIVVMGRYGSSRFRTGSRLARGLALAAGLSLAYMSLEAQWVRCSRLELPVPGLPRSWSGLTVLHLSDIHPDSFRSNLRVLAKVVRWARKQAPDLVFLTGDILSHSQGSKACLALLSQLEPPLGMFAVTGNHEYGLSKGLKARAHPTTSTYAGTRITLLADACTELPARDGTRLLICGADYLTGGFDLLGKVEKLRLPASPATSGADGAVFPILLAHEPPPPNSPLTLVFPLAFAGHTHGGQLRLPGRSGFRPPHMPHTRFLAGPYPWGRGLLVVSAGIGTSFLPLRLFTRPEATLWRLVYTTSCKPQLPEKLSS